MDLKENFRINYEYILLVAIFVFALGLRLWGISFGLPYVGYANDEKLIADGAIEILRQEDADFSQWGIGKALLYTHAIIGKIIFAFKGLNSNDVPTYVEIVTANNIDPAHGIGVPYPVPEFYWWGRATVAFLGALSVVIVYLLGKKIQTPLAGLISAFFLAGLSLHVEESHYLTRTVPGAFLLLLSLYIILMAYLKRSWRLFLFAGLLVYLAVYAKQNNLILLAPLALALIFHLWHQRQYHSTRDMMAYAIILIGVLTLAFSLAWDFFQFNILSYASYIFSRIVDNEYVFGGRHFGSSGDNTVLWIIDQLFLSSRTSWKLVSFLAIPGLLIALFLKEPGWLILLVLVPYLLLMSFFTVRFIWWLIPSIMILVLLAGLTFDWTYRRVSRMNLVSQRSLNAIFLVLAFLILAPSIRTAVTLNFYAGQSDVRNTASEWMRVNLPRGSKVFLGAWGPYLDSDHYQAHYVQSVGGMDLETYQKKGVDYLVINSFSVANVVSAQADSRERENASIQLKRLKRITEECSLEQYFTGPALFNLPIIEVNIYRVPESSR